MADQLTAKELLVKQPDEEIIYTMDFSVRIDEDVTINSVSSVTSELVSGGTSDLTISNAQVVDESVTMLIEGGTHGRTYRVEVAISLSTGEIFIGAGMLKVSTR